MIITESWIRRKFRNLLIRLYTRIENEGNIDFSTNGEKHFLDALTRFYANIKTSDDPLQLFDIGANQGDFSDLLRARMGKAARIHVFEPSELLCNRLRARFANSESTYINQMGVASTEGTQVLYSDMDGSPLASFIQRDVVTTGLELSRQNRVPTIRLDTYIESMGIDHIDFIKIDTEGYEFEVIDSLGRYLDPTFIDFVQFEYGGTSLDAGVSLRKFFTRFEASGFVVAKIMRSGLMVRPYGEWMDDFRYANFVAISGQKMPLVSCA
jgi:FkbM family methyltransferase